MTCDNKAHCITKVKALALDMLIEHMEVTHLWANLDTVEAMLNKALHQVREDLGCSSS